LKRIKLLLSLCLICALLITNVITVASATLGYALSGIMGAVLGRKVIPAMSPARLTSRSDAQLATQLDAQKRENKLLKDRLSKYRTSVARVGSNAAKRTKRLALYNITESTLGSLPIAGITLLVAGTAWELKQLCDGMKDIDDLYDELEITEDEIEGGVMDFVCRAALSNPDDSLTEDSGN
jgi:hypothetical protein